MILHFGTRLLQIIRSTELNSAGAGYFRELGVVHNHRPTDVKSAVAGNLRAVRRS